ncbi:hypothetical protein [Pseudarthrobacter oxydans]|uniref:hypothetical protein n=1 Tax=Pseudarthrobacter oxydans TaxID=1671 RepID=UPI00344D3318
MSIASLESAAEIVPHVSLQDISFLEESVRRADGGFEGIKLSDGEDDAPTEFNLLVHKDLESLRFRLSVHVATDRGEIRTDMAGHWKLDQEYDVSDAAALEFGNKVAVFALFPYVRESVHRLSLRVLQKPLLLPIIRQGEMDFTAAGTSTAHESADASLQEPIKDS